MDQAPAPASLTCPNCGRPLTYRRTTMNAETGTECEEFDCPECGRFEYQPATKKLTPTDAANKDACS